MVLLYRFLCEAMKQSWIFSSHWFSAALVLLGSATLARAGISSDSHVHMCGRLRGGAGGGRVQLKGSGTAKLAVWWGAGPRCASAFGVAIRATCGMVVRLEENHGVLRGSKTR